MNHSENSYHATPYDLDAHGFYFSTLKEYLEKAEKHTNTYGQKVEEFEIQFIDGDYPELFRELKINQANLHIWFEYFEELEEEKALKYLYLSADLGMDMKAIQDFDLDAIYLFEGTAKAYAEHYLEETGQIEQIPEHLRYYFDYEAYARDLVLGSDIAEFQAPDGTNYIIPQNF
ncbi:MAG: antirestriction protein ArdA [Bacteroidota bacterium]